MTSLRAFPVDEHDRALVDNVHPPDWPAPRPADRYNLVVIGAGAAGLVSAMGTAGLGGRVAIVERHLLGGDCLVTGCVPSKALIRAARAAHEARTAERFGVRVPEVEVDFPAVMRRLRQQRARISDHDAATRLRDAGVDVFLGEGRFLGPDVLEVDGARLRFARAIIATGARPVRPPIPGLDEAGALTSEEVWNLDALPARLVVVGAGPIGCELAQAFQRLGSQVTLVDQADRVLPRDDPDASAIVARRLAREGVRLMLGAEVQRFSRDGGAKAVHVSGTALACDEVLLALGRRANVDALQPAAAGVRTDAQGQLMVDARLRTTNPRVFAAGDVAGGLQFTHAADAMARMVLRNALFFGRRRAADLRIPWVTYTDPEVAQVGISASQAASDASVSTVQVAMASNDRAIVDGEDEGFARIHHDRRGRILGATLVGSQAGELVAAVALLMSAGGTMATLADTVLAYPTQAEVLKRAGDQFNRGRLTPFVASLLSSWLAWRR